MNRPVYAENTQVPVDRSRAEIERTLTRYGATAFAYATEATRSVIMFEAHGRRIRFDLAVPDREARPITHTPSGIRRSKAQVVTAWEQAVRARWRALLLIIKAKLEAVNSGIVSFETEFSGYVVLPDGSTVGDWLRPQLARAYDSGLMPPMLGLGPGGSETGSAR